MKLFLKKLTVFFLSISKSRNWIRREVKSDERITRFVFSRSHIRGNGSVKHQAFSPNKDNNISVYRTNECTDVHLTWIAEWCVKYLHGSGKEVVARADITSDAILTKDLKILPMYMPNPRHAEVRGWGNEEDTKMKTMLLAQSATMHSFNGKEWS